MFAVATVNRPAQTEESRRTFDALRAGSKLLYIMNEHPSVTETFVVTEAAAVRSLAVAVVGYAIRRGPAGRPAARVDLICSPPTPAQLVWTALRDPSVVLRAIRQARRAHATTREMCRLVFAHLHGTYALRSARQAGVTHVHAHFLGRPSDIASVLAERLACAWTATAHAGDVYAPTEPALLKSRIQSVAAVACASRSVQRAVRSHANARTRTGVVRCGIDTSALQFRSDRESARVPHLASVGRLVATKGHWTILEAAEMLIGRDESVRWTIAGDGPLRRPLDRRARERGLTPRLAFAGAVDHFEALALIDHSDLLVLPCEEDEQGDSDGIPVALIEAMALGVLVVTTPVGGIPELVVPNETGFLVQPRDASGLAETIEQILHGTAQEDLGRVRRAARAKVEREFDVFSEARALVELLKPYGVNPDGVSTPLLTASAELQ